VNGWFRSSIIGSATQTQAKPVVLKVKMAIRVPARSFVMATNLTLSFSARGLLRELAKSRAAISPRITINITRHRFMEAKMRSNVPYQRPRSTDTLHGTETQSRGFAASGLIANTSMSNMLNLSI